MKHNTATTKKLGRPLKGSEKLEKRLGFRIPKSVHDRILKVCDEKGVSKSHFILDSIRKNLFVQEARLK